MKRILKGEPAPHFVICDTNILWHEDKSLVVAPEFDAFWDTHIADFDLSLHIPEIVKGELLFQQFTSCIKLIKTVDEAFGKISSITSRPKRHRIAQEKTRQEIQERFDRWIRGKKGTTIALPHHKIDWARVAEDALWRRGVFAPDAKNPEIEKGFRDCLILESICDFVTTNTQDINIAFLCNDQLLRKTASGRLKDDKRFVTYETLKEFASYLSLTKEKLTNEFISSILARARAKFFTSADPLSLWFKDSISTRIKEKFGAYFDDVSKSDKDIFFSLGIGSFGTKWIGASDGSFWIASPEYVRIEPERLYVWKSGVTYVKLFKREISGGNPESPLKTDQRILLLSFAVEWSAVVKSDARFHELKLGAINMTSNQFRLLTDEDKKQYGFNDKS